MSKSREQLNRYLGTIDITGKRVLDIGVQDKPSSMQTRGDAKEYLTLDIDAQWSPDIVMDLNYPIGKLNTSYANAIVEEQSQKGFDIVFCIEVLEHCWNPLQVMENIKDWLVPGGKVYISTPFINPHHDYVDYLRYTDEWYRDVLPKVGLEVESIQERRATVGLDLLRQFYKIEGMKYSKIRQVKGPYSYPVGYFVTATKI